jgi:hypothetical protein
MKLQSSTLPIYSNLLLSLSPIYITLPPSISHSPSLHVSLTLSHPPSLFPPLLVTSLSLFLPPSIPLYSTHSHPPIISLWLFLTLTSSLPIDLSTLSFCFSTYLSNTHPLYLFVPVIISLHFLSLSPYQFLCLSHFSTLSIPLSSFPTSFFYFSPSLCPPYISPSSSEQPSLPPSISISLSSPFHLFPPLPHSPTRSLSLSLSLYYQPSFSPLMSPSHFHLLTLPLTLPYLPLSPTLCHHISPSHTHSLTLSISLLLVSLSLS